MSKEKVSVHRPIHETFTIGALLAVVGGFLDAYTYLLRGGVFANAQTGNIVLLAIRFAEGEIHRALYYLAPIFAFILGIFVTGLIKRKLTKAGFHTWEHIILLVEIVLLFFIGFATEKVPNEVVNVTISFICSIQVNSFRKIRDISYASTMCTGNLRSGTESLFRYFLEGESGEGKNAVHYFGIILFFIAGAAIGTLFTNWWGIKSVWSCCVILGIIFLELAIKNRR